MSARANTEKPYQIYDRSNYHDHVYELHVFGAPTAQVRCRKRWNPQVHMIWLIHGPQRIATARAVIEGLQELQKWADRLEKKIGPKKENQDG